MLKVAIAQIAPVFLRREATIEKVLVRLREAAGEGARLVCFGETLVPGYPVWIERTDGARFEDPLQQELHALYLDQAVSIEEGHLDRVAAAAQEHDLTVVLGVAERPADRGGHTVYCSRVVLEPSGRIASVHRKLMPTHEERLAWGVGDGAGLVTHRVGAFNMGALNCWENWIPLARAALYASGENLHVALWPGARHNTEEITRFIAREGRSYVISASSLLREADIPPDVPARERIASEGELLKDGASCIANPDGSWLVEPVVGEERMIYAELDIAAVRRARHSFDPVGHYSRPDVLRLTVDRRRQAAASFLDDDSDE